DLIVVPILLEDISRLLDVLARDLGKCLRDIALLQQPLLASAFPELASNALKSLPKIVKLTPLVQIALKLRDITLLAVVATSFVEDLDEHGQQRVKLLFADYVGLLIDIE